MSHANEQLSRHYEREAESTRRSLANSLNELNQRLTPGQIFDEMLTYAKGSGGTFVQSFSNAVRENPFPALLVGTGCMMFLADKAGITNRLSDRGYARDRRHYAAEEREGKGIGEATKERVAQAAESVKEGMADVGDAVLDVSRKAREATHHMRESVSGAVEQAKHTAQDVRERVTETAAHTGEQAMEAGRQAKDRASRLMHEQPMLVAGLGLALGAAIAALLPSTRWEDEIMGETSDKVKKKVGEAAQQQFETAKETATELADKAREIAERENLTSPGAAAEVVRRVAGDASEGQTPRAGEGGSDEPLQRM